jgi:hypothetical protein
VIKGEMIMDFTEVLLKIVLPILSGIVTAIPLVIQLVKFINAAIKEKNFANIMKIVIDLLPEAEEKFSTGEERKAYVMDNIRSLSQTLDYEVDFDKISEMIDAIIGITKRVNK